MLLFRLIQYAVNTCVLKRDNWSFERNEIFVNHIPARFGLWFYLLFELEFWYFFWYSKCSNLSGSRTCFSFKSKFSIKFVGSSTTYSVLSRRVVCFFFLNSICNGSFKNFLNFLFIIFIILWLFIIANIQKRFNCISFN